VNAGTVEFLLDQDGAFYFLEVNTRLQVEHPITEMTTGLDLVRCQVEVAAGLPLPFAQGDIQPRGHAIECRIYAEDPIGFLPSPGRVIQMVSPDGPGVRFDSGVFPGAEVPVHYDPIMGKLIVHAGDRDAAIARMIRALQECVVLGVRTSVEFMIDVLASEAFASGDTHTGFLPEHMGDWRPDESRDALPLAGHLLGKNRSTAVSRSDPSAPCPDTTSPWQRLGSWDMAQGD
ncbi:MAG: acetyl-CoA carboxylase biotin carboxylase subunit, partial [Deltaproteobacteria bacterium]|nr:acetyl-CoA carboxylase biotin carboxylase subunit [Deltaproteobacteria bacterium]